MISGYELLVVKGEQITADLLIWRRYRTRAPGMVEAMLDANPHLAKIHKDGPFIPVGTHVRIPIDLDILKGSPQISKQSLTWVDNPHI